MGSIFGIMLIIKPTFLFNQNKVEQVNFIGCIFGLTSSGVSALVVILIRDLGKSVSTSEIV